MLLQTAIYCGIPAALDGFKAAQQDASPSTARSDGRGVQSPERIGFVGIGNMGWPMARNLVKAGFEVTVLDARARHRGEASASTPHCAADLAGVGAACRSGHHHRARRPQVREAVLGERGSLPSLAPGMLVIDMTSASPGGTQEIGGDLGGAWRRDDRLPRSPAACRAP